MLQQHHQSVENKLKKRYQGIGFKAAHMGIARQSLWRYLRGDWKKPDNFDERFATACRAYEKQKGKNNA